jgi:large subunit ribosomal protein L10
MAITKEQKKQISEKLNSAIQDSATVTLVSFKALGVQANNVLRKNLRANQANYFVAKKTLLDRALDAANIPGTKPELGEGMVALAYGTDPMAPAREVFNFSKENPGKIEIIGGIFEGSFKSREEMLQIATIPGMETLRGMFANIINSPRQRFAVVLDQVAEKKS